ncbi:hypothetical protein [Pseudomonas fluorescens]|uniref:Receptor protein-tyrosine kinase n=1 Tax=Pseudomonas fluorescens TaxID=294 RepID=A0A5E6QDY0_PSEFL|nr:hypothetical protein [Pseudomonas fluorescens]VVM54151.1 hypothetical protein PS624_00942 [Pseudomonas fluorescens]
MNPNSQRYNSKVYYSPLEAAIRWSGLLEQETEILSKTTSRLSLIEDQDQDQVQDWPTLNLNVERLFDAMRHQELPFGKSGITHCDPALLVSSELSIRHIDLKRWMAAAYPAHKPPFLFDEAERQLPTCLAYQMFQSLFGQCQSAGFIPEDRKQSSTGDKPARLAGRAETTYLNIIGALLTLLLGHSPSGNRYSAFNTLESVIQALIAHHSGRPGITERTLWAKFAEAKRQLNTEP